MKERSKRCLRGQPQASHFKFQIIFAIGLPSYFPPRRIILFRLLAEMSNSFRSDIDSSFNAEELLKIKTRCKELRKEKDMINSSQSQIFELLRVVELHEKSSLEASTQDKKHIQRLEEELLNCSQEIVYLKDQLNGRNMEVKYLQGLVYSLKLKIKDMEGLQDEVIRLKEELQRSNSEQFLLLEELEAKEMELEKATLSVERLEESISSIALESECEVECLKLDMLALEQSHFEAKKVQEETLEENTRMSRLIEELQFKFQEAEKCIVSLNEESRKLKNKIDAVNMNTRKFSRKVEEWLENKDRSQLNDQSSFRVQEKDPDISKGISVYGEVLGSLLGRLSMALETDASIKEEMEKMSYQMQKYEMLVEKLKEELREEKSKAKEEAEDLAQEMAELRYQVTSLLEEESKHRACFEQASLQRIAELEAQLQREQRKSLFAVSGLPET